MAGDAGVGGPFASVPGSGVLLARGPAGGNKSQAWEGKQGIDSFCAFRAPGKGGQPTPSTHPSTHTLPHTPFHTHLQPAAAQRATCVKPFRRA